MNTTRRWRKRCGYRCRLLAMFAGVFVFLAVVSTVATIWYVSRLVNAVEMEEGAQIAENFARGSVIALTFNAAENAEKEAQSTLSFPNIGYVAIHNQSGATIFQSGPVVRDAPTISPTERLTATRIIDTGNTWHVFAPVFATDTTTDSPFVVNRQDPEYLGYVHVVRTKDTIQKLESRILIFALLFSIASGGVMIYVLIRLINYFATPVDELAAAMANADTAARSIRVPERGPPEVVNMARAFNRLMELLQKHESALRRQRDDLEREVHVRTAELVVARDRAVAASRHKSEFLAMVSHELRTPLQAIIGYGETVMLELESAQNTAMAHDMRVVIDSAEHLLSLINQILDVSKIESGQISLDLKDVEIADLAEDISNSVKPLADQNQNTIKTTITAERSVMRVDVEKVRQIAVNLLGNACKFTENGQIEFRVNRTSRELEMVVADTGIGIDEQHHAKIFEAFHQVDMKATRKHGGTGLGLAITKQLCGLMKGSISVKSALGRGATFTVRIPID